MEVLDRFFQIKASGSTVRREVTGGVTTFATMSYIVFVQPTVLTIAGMDFGSVLLATCLSSAVACILMGLLARYPFALAPGMGENFLFVFTVCIAMKFSWQAALAIIFISGVLFTLLSIFQFRERVLDVLPGCLKNSIGPAIGLFIAFIGMQWGGIIVLDPATMVKIGSVHHGPPLIVLLGVLIIVTLHAFNFRGALLAGLLVTMGLGLWTGIISTEVERPHLNFSTFFQLDFGELLSRWHTAMVAILLFFFLDLFDTIGMLVGVGTQAGFITEDGKLPRAGRAFLADALSTCVGALFGTSTVTSYIESATGVAAGARTGLATIVTGLCFVLAIAFAPIIALAGQDIGQVYYEQLGIPNSHVAMYPAVAPALIVVGLLMIAPLRNVKWDDVTEALPAFLTLSIMSLGYGITEGISAGCVSFAAIKTTTGRVREVHPIMYAIAFALVLRYVYLT